jgi:hypothetical protein
MCNSKTQQGHLEGLFMSKSHTGRYVKVNSSGQVELRLTSGGSPLCYFAFDAVFAILMGDLVQVNRKDGSTVFYKLSSDGYGVSGPYMSI